MKKRIESDFLGKVEVPADAYYGIFTVRASNTFKISGKRVDMRIIRAFISIKKAAALTNGELKVLDKKIADAIIRACDEALLGKFDDEFILDAFQAGAGTPMHMNVNEVLANRATEILGGKKGEYLVHPNNHVNMAQSSNDVTHTAIRIAALIETKTIVRELELLKKSFETHGKRYDKLLKTGRTHLQDAVPITYGQVFNAYATAIGEDIARIRATSEAFQFLGIGGTAVGTGITTHPKFKERVTAHLSKLTGFALKPTHRTVQTTHDMNVFLTFSGALRSYATTLNRIANDLRLLTSGPKAGIAEIILPAVEPGSSIMPGKINPSVPECINMLCFQVLGNDQAISLACQSGQLELNWMTPLIGHNIIESLDLLKNGTRVFRGECVDGMHVDEERTRKLLDSSFAYATAFNPYLGYSVVSKLVTESYTKNVPLRKLIVQKGLLSEDDVHKIIEKSGGPAEIDQNILRRVRT